MIEHLKSILKQEDTVLFIGSGVSLWSGLPSWFGLINELVEFMQLKGLDPFLVKQELSRSELLQAASYGFDKLTKYQIAEFIRKACRLNSAKPHEIHKKIISLGPKCFMTTNYDKLLELSFQKWIPDIHFLTVTNRQLTETAEIVGARASNFLFKLHGDAEDSDSIILTREQYRALNPGGELHHALETAKILMASRPIVYIGFGLRDPDFIYLKDILFNTYNGGSRDHYAIVSDIREDEKDYWRRNFGIHLINYNTSDLGTGKKDHSSLLSLLDELQLNYRSAKGIKQTTINADFLLSLARHANKYLEHGNLQFIVPLVVHPLEKNKRKKFDFSWQRYYGESIETLLDNGPEKFILVGLPGSGKTFALRRSMARFSEKLNEQCIAEVFQANITLVPIFADLKLYKGNIYELLEESLPITINLDFLLAHFKIKIFLDAFNEIPREFIESNHWDHDFLAFLQKATNCLLIISSRTSDGLENLELPIFNLDSIDEEFVKNRLTETHLQLQGSFKNEILNILQRPFFYKLVFSDGFEISSETTPKQIYSNLLSLITVRFNKKFQTILDLQSPLSLAAMEAIDAGEEAFNLEKLNNYFALEIGKNGIRTVSSSDIINWLVSEDFLIPIANKRICFFHQSITEFLAATRLARIFEISPDVLKEKLSFRRWDQALFLTLSLLNKDYSKPFLEFIINIDFKLALSSVKYMEGDTEEVVKRLLLEMQIRASENFDSMFDLAYFLNSIAPITKHHISTLKKLIKVGNAFGGFAAARILQISGKSFKQNSLNLLIENCEDYNFCSTIAETLSEFVTESDFPKLVKMTDKVQKNVASRKIKNYAGFQLAISKLLKGLDEYQVYKAFFNTNIARENQQVHIDVLCDFLRDCDTENGLAIASDLLIAGIDCAVYVICLITGFAESHNSLDYSVFDKNHLKSLIKILKNKKNKNSHWAMGALKNICKRRTDFTSVILTEVSKSNGMTKAALSYIVSDNNDFSPVFEALEGLCNLASSQLSKEPFSLLGKMYKISWKGREKLLLKLLKQRNIHLAYEICDSLLLLNRQELAITLDIGPIYWWLDWLTESYHTKTGEEYLFRDRLSFVLAKYTPKDKRGEFVKEFNNPNSPFRKVLMRTVLRKLEDLSLEELTEETIMYLLEQLKTDHIDTFNRNILEDVATEQFVNEKLLPLEKVAKGNQLKNLRILLDQIGRKHGRRYF